MDDKNYFLAAIPPCINHTALTKKTTTTTATLKDALKAIVGATDETTISPRKLVSAANLKSILNVTASRASTSTSTAASSSSSAMCDAQAPLSYYYVQSGQSGALPLPLLRPMTAVAA